MTRIKRGVVAHKRHKKIIKQTKGYYSANSRVYRVAHQMVIKSNQYAYRDRRNRKRFFRQLWITRINAAVCQHQISYNEFIYGLKKSSIILNRKILADIAISDKTTFANLVSTIKSNSLIE